MPVGKQYSQIYLPGLSYEEVYKILQEFKEKYKCTGSCGLDVQLGIVYVVLNKRRHDKFMTFVKSSTGVSPH